MAGRMLFLAQQRAESSPTPEHRERRRSSVQALTEGGSALAVQFALACGVRPSKDVLAAALVFRKQKTREFWNYTLFLVLFSLSTLQQRPVEQTHDFISQTIDATVMGNGFTSVTYFKTLEDVGSVEDFWGSVLTNE
jgi:hypothetical protein